MTCQTYHHLSDESYEQDTVHGVLRSHSERSNFDLALQRVEQLLHRVLGTVDPKSLGRGHVPGRGEAEAAFTAVHDLVEEEAERRLVVHGSELRLVLIAHVHERIIDPEPLR